MTFNTKEILKFIFPEWKIIDAIKKRGFIAKANTNIQVKQTSKVEQTHTSGYGAASSNGLNKNQGSQKNTFKKSTSSPQGNAAMYQHKDTRKYDTNNISETFQTIREELGNTIIGQGHFLDELCVAFKRPFVTGHDKIKPKNIMLLIGNKGSGKHYSISTMANAMKDKKLISTNAVLTIDLSLYPTVSEFNLFLSDLYNCLYGQSDMVVFDHFDKCHSNMIDVISTLSLTGKYTLGSRYILQDNNLVEATGMLLQDPISELASKGKYFIFISEKGEKSFHETFGSKFMEAVSDIVYTDAFSKEDLAKLATRIMESVSKRCSQNLSLVVSYDHSVIERITSNFKKQTGVIGLDDYATATIYKPLAEYKLLNSIKANQSVSLSVGDGEFIAQLDGTNVNLSEVIPKKMNVGIEDVKKELEAIIGIESVKQYILSLEDNLKIQKAREHAGFKTADISMHMIFTGNPGTGKTTIARIVAKYLKALGVLSIGQLREVTRADLVGQYVGHTAKQTNDVIKSALGGVLFIDEAYALCRDKHDTFGLEAIDTLVKGIEDNRNDLLVILAGYKDEMSEFLNINSGLRSRFPNLINFDDYTSDEMYQISLITAKQKGYQIVDDCKDDLIKLFDKKQIKGRNDSGNGRLVRNVIEDAILNQSKRLLADNTEEMDLLKYEDFKFAATEQFDLEASLSKIIGLDTVKEFVKTQYNLLIAQEKRRKAGMPVDTTQSLNMIFSGNPGTGKTTIARILATMFKEMGLLKSGHLVETDRGGLVAEYVGQTAKKTEELFRSALGGVLFIDEAYALSSDGGSFGKEAIDTLVKLIEDYRGEIVVILAGYKKEMTDFLKTNSGLESRFPLVIDFPDYTSDELFQISIKMISDKGFLLSDTVKPILKEQISMLHKKSNVHSGNGRMVRNYVEEIMRKQSARIAIHDIPIAEMNMIIPEDIASKQSNNGMFDLESELSKIIGLDEVKDYIRSLSARLRMQHERKKLGLTVDATQTLHMIFKGNPGTGKTMVARTVAQVLHSIGVIHTNKLVETDRAGLVAGYIGQTALKTKEKVMEAMDGVLFIDEAYSLSQGGPNDFGKEAIDTLVKLMDDYRDRLVVILAGYSNEMEQFLTVNPGLRSRFPNIIDFSDYTTEQLMQISQLIFQGQGYEIDQKAKTKLETILSEARKDAQFGNGRYVRNLFEYEFIF